MSKGILFLYIQNYAKKGEVALFCRALGVTEQGYKKHRNNQCKPYKYAELLADMYTILEEDVFNSNYGKRRMYEKLVQDFECTLCYNTVSTVMRENGLIQKGNHPKGLTKADKNAQKEDDKLGRDFTAEAPCKKNSN